MLQGDFKEFILKRLFPTAVHPVSLTSILILFSQQEVSKMASFITFSAKKKKVAATFLIDACYMFRRLSQMNAIHVAATEITIKESGNTRLLGCCVPNGHYE